MAIQILSKRRLPVWNPLVSNFYNMAYSLRTFRFIQLFSEFVMRPRQDHRFFSDYTEEDRAWIWVASMNNANMFDSSKMTPAEAKDAYETIRSYSDKHGSSLSLLESQIELLPRLWKGRPELEDEWKKQIREYAATFGEKGYSYYLDRLTNTYLRESTDRTIREVAASMLARRPKDFADLREVVEYHQEARSYRSRSLDEQIGFYTAVSLAYPTHATARIFLCSKLRQAKRLEKILRRRWPVLLKTSINIGKNLCRGFRAIEEGSRKSAMKKY